MTAFSSFEISFIIILAVFCLSFVLRSESGTAVGTEATNNSNPLFYYVEDSTRTAEELLNAADIMVGGDIPLTVQVRKAEEFPVLLHPGQRAAVFVELPDGFKEQLIFTCSPQTRAASISLAGNIGQNFVFHHRSHCVCAGLIFRRRSLFPLFRRCLLSGGRFSKRDC